MYNLTLLAEIAPIAIVMFVGWAGWMTKQVIEIQKCNAATNQEVKDFIAEYRSNHK